MKKSQLFALVGFLLGWGAPAGALVLKFLWLGMPTNPIAFMEQVWVQNPFLYWYMLLGTSFVLTAAGYLLGKNQDTEDLRNLQRVDEAIHDALTGLASHRRMHELFAVEFKRHLDSRQPISCLMIDLDEFNRINEAYGRSLGDTILKDFAQLLRHSIRQGDTATRYGGEEFLCIMPDCDEKNAKAVAERVRMDTEKLVFPLGKAPGRLTVSIGAVTVHDMQRADYHFMIAESDRNLYRAKAQGRNRTVQTVFHERRAKTA